MNRQDYTKCNRQMWNETAAIRAHVERARPFEQVYQLIFLRLMTWKSTYFRILV